MEENNIKLTKLAKCAGCGAKVGAGVLAQLLEGIKVHQDPNLLVGFDKSDDASVYKVSEDLALVQTVDFFPPIADDPYLFGQIAATNALSDVYAMGGEPKLCLNTMAVPESMPREAVHQILRGGYDKVYEAGALITGGHSILDDEPKYGLAVTGFVRPDRVLTNSGAKPGDVLLLTKPLGIGVLNTAQKAELLSPEGEAVCLVKPQFEAGREKVGKKGVVRDPVVHLEVLETFLHHAKENHFTVLGITYSPIRGPEGNIEYLGYLRHGQGTPGDFSLPEIVEASHSQLKD